MPQAPIQDFDVQTKIWKSWASTTPQLKIEAKKFLHAELVGSKLFVVMTDSRPTCYIYSYNTETNVWENIPHSLGAIGELCIAGDYMYVIRTRLEANCSRVSERYNFAKRRWQRYAEVTIPKSDNYGIYFYNSGATVFNSKVYVLYGSKPKPDEFTAKPAVLLYFDPDKNKWEQKASTRRPHFGSTLFIVNSRIYVAGGNVSVYNSSGNPVGDPTPVEVYDEENDSWSVVKQRHIPPNKLGAVEVEGRVYFIINRFPIDSSIRIPPGEKYHVDLDDWENLGKVDKSAVLRYLPIKRESFNTE